MLFAHNWATPFFCASLWLFGYWLVQFLCKDSSPIVGVAWIFIVFFLEVVVTFFDMFVEHPNIAMKSRILVPIGILLLFVASTLALLFYVSEKIGGDMKQEYKLILLTITFGMASLIKFMQVWLPNNFPKYIVGIVVAQSGGVYKRNFSA